MFKAAKFLEVRELMSQLMCCIDDKRVIGEREALSIYLKAKECSETALQDFMKIKISKIFLTFVASWEFLTLKYQEVEDFLKSNRVGVNSEFDMLFVAIRWLQHEWPLRKKKVSRLLEFVRFELIQSWQLVEMKKFPKELSHIFKHKEVQEMIDKALSHVSLLHADYNPEDESLPQVFNRRLISDPMWNEFQFERNANLFENFCNFCKYLKQIDGET